MLITGTKKLPGDIATTGDIELLVRSFYRHAAMDSLLEPVFTAAEVDWPSHISTLIDFWSWQLLGGRDYTGTPLRAHVPIHAATPFTQEHFERWLDLFTSTVDDHFAGPTADAAKVRATKMAGALRRILGC